ncbi:40S ribosomal protein S5-1 [Hordeum vulgare]|nr:40S ribosomal protein S5-1 [Hordeum vulgare]
MASPKAPKDKIFEKVINPYLAGVLQHPQSIEMREGMLHIRDVGGPKKTRNVEARLEVMEQQVFKCQGMVERGLNANHMMITEFTNKHKIDTNDIRKHLSRLCDRIDHLQAQIYDLQNQNCRQTQQASKLAESTMAAGARYANSSNRLSSNGNRASTRARGTKASSSRGKPAAGRAPAGDLVPGTGMGQGGGAVTKGGAARGERRRG